MSTKPIDFQITIPRTYETSRVEHNIKAANDNKMMIIASNFKNEVEISKRKVNISENAGGVKIEKEKNNRAKDERKKDKKNQEIYESNDDKKVNMSNKKTSHIDIRV
ncbi:hypothetical protein [Thermovenabulum sp.]|uniref:hypothetical protein n=1 Tax=Thermovenabulum sp. TaxID=3100335 RepID=UPI003C7CEF20